MKKRYFQPSMAVVKYDLCQPMLTASMPLSNLETSIQFGREGLIIPGEEDPINLLLGK